MPSGAGLEPGEGAVFQMSFVPMEACSYEVSAAVQLDSGASSLVAISGIGKYPYLSIEQTLVDFGDVVVGKSAERMLRFGNHANVVANFSVEHDSPANDGVFSVGPTHGSLGPDEYSVMRVTYTPKSFGTFSAESFAIFTAGGNRLQLRVRGNAQAPRVVPSAHSFNYGNVAAGIAVSRVLYLANESPVPVTYDFQSDPDDIFKVSKPRGVIPAESTGHVTITVNTAVPSNYWRRLTCLLKDADPISVDLLATVFNDKSRPPPLTRRHLARYMVRVLAGGEPVEDEQLLSKPPSAAAGLYSTAGELSALNLPAGSLRETAALGPPGGEALAKLDAMAAADAGSGAEVLPGPHAWDLAFEGQDPARGISLDTDTLDFGACSRATAGEYKSVTVTNRTAAKVMAFFKVPAWADPGGIVGEPKPVFQVRLRGV